MKEKIGEFLVNTLRPDLNEIAEEWSEWGTKLMDILDYKEGDENLLMYAAKNGEADFITTLLLIKELAMSYGIKLPEIDTKLENLLLTQDKDGKNALMHALESNSEHKSYIIGRLIEQANSIFMDTKDNAAEKRAAFAKQQDKDGNTLFDYAIKYNAKLSFGSSDMANPEILNLVDVNHQDKDRKTPLMKALQANVDDAGKNLIKNPVTDLNVQDKDGKTALNYFLDLEAKNKLSCRLYRAVLDNSQKMQFKGTDGNLHSMNEGETLKYLIENNPGSGENTANQIQLALRENLEKSHYKESINEIEYKQQLSSLLKNYYLAALEKDCTRIIKRNLFDIGTYLDADVKSKTINYIEAHDNKNLEKGSAKERLILELKDEFRKEQAGIGREIRQKRFDAVVEFLGIKKQNLANKASSKKTISKLKKEQAELGKIIRAGNKTKSWSGRVIDAAYKITERSK